MRVIDDIFSEEELTIIDKEVAELTIPPKEMGSRPQWRTNHYYWGRNLDYPFDSGHVLYYDCGQKVTQIVLDKIKKTTNLTAKGSPIRYSLWCGDSGASWHPDGSVGFTFYLTPWPIEYGGQLFYVNEGVVNERAMSINGQSYSTFERNPKERQSMIPVKRNRLVINENQTMHRVSRVRHVRDPRNNVRLTIQVFALE